MATGKDFETISGPWTNLSSVYCGQIDAMLRAGDPMLRAASRVQLEWMHLAMQRGRAWASLPAELSRCKSPVDVVALQTRFLQAMGLNYAEGLTRIWQTSSALALTPAGQNGSGKSRDIIDVRSEAGVGERRTQNRQAA